MEKNVCFIIHGWCVLIENSENNVGIRHSWQKLIDLDSEKDYIFGIYVLVSLFMFNVCYLTIAFKDIPARRMYLMIPIVFLSLHLFGSFP